jgi:predicted PurR-regulated permease PerM
MREAIWHKDPDTGRYTPIKPWWFGTIIGLAIGDIFTHHSQYHFATAQQILSTLLAIMGTLLATAIGATTVAVIVLAFRMLLDRRRIKLARG